MQRLDYESAGVRYDTLDAFKRACQKAAASTTSMLARHRLREPEGVRGESAYLIETADGFLAHVEEGLGTKNLVADAMAKLTGQCFYESIAIDTVATIVNDLITTGALPISVAMHAAVGDSDWFADEQRATALANGFTEACRRSGAVWSGGETPALKGIIEPGTIALAGSAIGQIFPKSNRIAGNIQQGDAIVLLASSGVQTNGLTLCRAVAERLGDGYLTLTADGRTYGQALLEPSEIYVDFVAACQDVKLRLNYAVHMTGHGWRKLMRSPANFVYEMNDLGEAHAVFKTIASAAQLEDREMYATFNMGAGFAVFVAPEQAQQCIELARSTNHFAWVGGTVKKEADRKAVVLQPIDVCFESDTLHIR